MDRVHTRVHRADNHVHVAGMKISNNILRLFIQTAHPPMVASQSKVTNTNSTSWFVTIYLYLSFYKGGYFLLLELFSSTRTSCLLYLYLYLASLETLQSLNLQALRLLKGPYPPPIWCNAVQLGRTMPLVVTIVKNCAETAPLLTFFCIVPKGFGLQNFFLTLDTFVFIIANLFFFFIKLYMFFRFRFIFNSTFPFIFHYVADVIFCSML